ncbi:hypothetical protein NC653_035189 [Populus alba x Populus x berolinensis]|uniref:Uncharacterized protein n=1 Tax=Populus alba x Populus x berolinensis TaxID=444605 RepID=A0AAD6LPC6_9ROSI|nr:hypothetical protein NC653_035189 [Populus alba x Populus x berolinensis]
MPGEEGEAGLESSGQVWMQGQSWIRRRRYILSDRRGVCSIQDAWQRNWAQDDLPVEKRERERERGKGLH